MGKYSISQVFESSYQEFCSNYQPSQMQAKASSAIMQCKTGKLGRNSSLCSDCGHQETHNNSCRNRHCPNCQALTKEIWIDSRKSEVIDAPYFHLVFTVPPELNSLLYANQSLLYGLLHSCSKETILELAADDKYLGATCGIIQVLHTWGQQLNYHPHIHCIIAGAGITKAKQFKRGKQNFFLPVKVLSRKFRGKFLAKLQLFYDCEKLSLSNSCKHLRNAYEWNEFIDSLRSKDFIAYIKETFRGSSNAIDYLGRYTHRIAISNARILSVTEDQVSFWAKDYKQNNKRIVVTLSHVEFIKRFLRHVLPFGFQKIRYYGFLNNRYKKQNLRLIAKLTGKKLFTATYASMSTAELLLHLYDKNVYLCPACGCEHFYRSGRSYPRLE